MVVLEDYSPDIQLFIIIYILSLNTINKLKVKIKTISLKIPLIAKAKYATAKIM